jgi:hypothetical protein
VEKTDPTKPAREVYIVRLWREGLPQIHWNGEVQHIASGHVTPIRDLDSLLDFFQSQLSESTDENQLPSKLK